VAPGSLRDEAEEILGLVSMAPREAARRATELEAAAGRRDEWAARSVAARAHGLALAQVGPLSDAVTTLRRAVRLARRSGERDVDAEARGCLANVLSMQGRHGEALRQLELAPAVPGGAVAAHTSARRGTLLLRAGRVDLAIRELTASLESLRLLDDRSWVLTGLVNRGAAYLTRGDTAAAEADLTAAAALADDLGYTAEGAFARANLAFVHSLQGNVPKALASFADAEVHVRRSGTSVAPLLSMRAELLLSVRLLGEAQETAETAMAEFESEGNALGAADTRLLLAQIAARGGQHAKAGGLARQAGADFRRLGREDLAALCRLWRIATGSRVGAAEADAVVRAMVSAGWRGPAVEARILAFSRARTTAEREAGLRHLAEAARWRSRSGAADLRARAWFAEALRREAVGRPAGAERAALRGLEILDEHRASLPATDLRAHVAAHRTDLVRLGMRLTLAAGSARRVARWAERGRATHLLQRPVRPPDDPRLADRLAKLRRVVGDLYDARPAGTGQPEQDRLRQRQVALEREIRDLARAAGVDHFDPVGRPADLRDLGAALGDRALVEYVVLDGALHAVTLVAGRCRLHHLGPASVVEGLLERVPFAVQRMIRAARSPRGAAAATMLLADAGRRLDDVLLAPMRETTGRELVVVPTGMLQALPWSVLPSCRGRALTVSPSATVWLAATRRPTNPGHALVAAGPRLPSAPAEAKAVAALYGTEPVIDPEATVGSVMGSLSGAAVAHLATHGRLSAENPLFSHLLLSDGPLVVYDLERLPSLPHTVVLAACDSGRHVVRAGDELLGLGAAFLAGGTAQLVASVVPVPDAETASLMTALHAGLASGRPPAVALAQAQAAVAGSGAVAEATAAGFVCIGAGFVPVPFAAATQPADRAARSGHQPRARQTGSDGRSAPIVVSLP